MFARMIGRHLPRFIPGEPSVIVQNMPGAGGLRAANWLYNVAPKDGLTIGMINNTLAFDPLYGNQQAQFNAAKFNWLGTPSQETALLIVWHTVPVNTLADAKSRELILSATGAGSTPAFFARVLSALFDLKVKIIPGYKSQTAGFLAMEQGENDGNASPFWSSLSSEFPHWLKEKKIRPLVYYGAGRNPEIPAPHALDLLEDPEKRAIMEIAQAHCASRRRSGEGDPATRSSHAALQGSRLSGGMPEGVVELQHPLGWRGHAGLRQKDLRFAEVGGAENQCDLHAGAAKIAFRSVPGDCRAA
jgi:hypothetical protein